VRSGIYFSPSIVMSILSDVCCGLHYLHLYNIAHRDIRPQKLIVFFNSTKFSVKVTGLSWGKKFEFELEASHTVDPGSRVYRAPETTFTSSYTLSCDVWSFGLVIGDMFGQFPELRSNRDDFGEDPYTTTMLPEMGRIMCQDYLERRVKALQNIPSSPEFSWVSDILKSCLAFNPTDRPSFFHILVTLTETQQQQSLEANHSLLFLVQEALLILMATRFDENSAWSGMPTEIVCLIAQLTFMQRIRW